MQDPLVNRLKDRDEDVLAEAKELYGAGLRALAFRILGNREDAEEVENDAYCEAWECIPPAEPASLKSWLLMVTRRRALDRLDAKLAQKRGGGEAEAALDEMEDLLPGEDGRQWAGEIARKEVIRSFLTALPAQKRRIFLKRYWYFLSIREIAAEEGLSESHVKTILHRSRKSLKDQLIREDLWNE